MTFIVKCISNQKWPLINFVRQILKNINYKIAYISECLMDGLDPEIKILMLEKNKF